MKILDELMERLAYLETQEKTIEIESRISELKLVIVREQQILLDIINSAPKRKIIISKDAESLNENMFLKFGFPEDWLTPEKPLKNTGSSLIDAGKPDINTNLSLSEEEIEILLFVEDKSISFIDDKFSNRDILYALCDKNLLKIAGEFWELTDKGHEVVKLLKSFQNEKTHNKTTLNINTA